MAKKSTTTKKIKLETPVAKTKKTAPKVVSKAEKPKPTAPLRYFEAKGGRKTAAARVRLYTKNPGITVNGLEYQQYFRNLRLQNELLKPLKTMNAENKFGISVKVSGGGLPSQAEAVGHGIARALVLFNQDFRKRLRRTGLLTRDSRMVERKKYGLKKARRAPQWAKR